MTKEWGKLKEKLGLNSNTEPEDVPRCRQCKSRLTVLEDMYGKQRLWCIHCEAPFMK